MRKASQDGGDTLSITSGVENEIKKSGAIMKTKKNSIKRKVQNFSNDYDETVIEPLLQNDNERTETAMQSAKNLPITTKTDIISAKGNENNIILTDNYKKLPANSKVISETTSFTVPGIKENNVAKCLTNTIATVHNHMNTNVFASQNLTKSLITPSTQILVEIDRTKHISYSPSPLIFTTAKIHRDGKTQHMEPVQVTPVPILSIIELGVLKAVDGTEHEQRTKTNQALASTYSSSNASNVKSVEKVQKPNVTTSENNIAPGIISNNVPTITTTSDYNVQTTLIKTSPITKARDFTSSLTAADVKVPSTTNNLKDKVMGSSLTNDNKMIKEESKASEKISQPQSTSILQSNIPATSIPTTSNKIIDVTKEEEQNKKVDSTLVTMKQKVDETNEMQVKTDVNSNIQPIGVINIDPHCSGKSINVKNVTETSKHDKPLKNLTSSSTNKQLQRQKNTRIDDTNDSDTISKKSIPKESNNKSMSSPPKKITDHNVSDVTDKFMKPKSNITSTKPVPKVTGSVTSTGQPILCSATAIKPSPGNTATAASVKLNESSSNQSNELKAKSSTVKPLTATGMTKPAAIRVAVTTTINKQEPSIGSATVCSALTEVVATTRTASTTSCLTKFKTPNTTTSQAPSIKQPIASTISATTMPCSTSMTSAPISSSISSFASTSVKKSTTSKDISKPLSSNKNPGTSTAPSGVAVKSKMPTKRSGQKSSEQNNDGKSSKA